MNKFFSLWVLSTLLCLIFGYALGGYITQREAEIFYAKEIQSRTVTNAALVLGGLELMRQEDSDEAIAMYEKILCGYLLSTAINKNIEIENDDYIKKFWSRASQYVEAHFASTSKNNCWSTDKAKELILELTGQ